MSALAKLMMWLTSGYTLESFHDKCEDPRATQEALLRRILEDNAECAYGREYGFADIETWRDFQRRVPINDYEDLQPYIEQAMCGIHAQLTVEEPTLFAMTSGTTGASKYIPVTPASRKAKADLMKVWLSGFYQDHPDIFNGTILSVVSPEVETRSPCGIPCGAESGHAYRNLPAAIQGIYAIPYEVFEIDDYEARYYTILRIAIAQDISFVATANPSTILVLCRRLMAHTDSLINDLRDGRLADRVELTAKQLESIGPYLAADPERADELAAAAARHEGVLTPKIVWPRIAAVACWHGGSVGAYIEKIKPFFPADMPMRDLGYLSSEHRGSAPLFDDSDAGVLAIDTNVYEFFPADTDAEPEPEQLLAVDEIELHQCYRVYVTTLGGLYRYNMNDIVQVTAFYAGKTPIIRFLQKEKGIISFTGEKLTETQVIEAVREAFGEFNDYEFIAAVGAFGDAGDPFYSFLVEFGTPVRKGALAHLPRLIDKCLCERNDEYAAKRKSKRLGAPVLNVVRTGQWDEYRKRKVSAGGCDGQFKILRLTDNDELITEFQICEVICHESD